MGSEFIRLCAFGSDPVSLRMRAELGAADIPHVVQPSRSKSDNLNTGFRHSLGLQGAQEIAVPSDRLAEAKALADRVVSEMAARFVPTEYKCPKCESVVQEPTRGPRVSLVTTIISALRGFFQGDRWQCEQCGHVMSLDEIEEQRLAWDEDDPMFEGVDFGDPGEH